MVKHTQTIHWQHPINYLSGFVHFVRLALKGLIALHHKAGNETNSLLYFMCFNFEENMLYEEKVSGRLCGERTSESFLEYFQKQAEEFPSITLEP